MPSTPGARLRSVSLVLCALAFATCVVLAGTHWLMFRAYDAGGYCSVGETFDCRTVAWSRFAVVGDIPLPLWGIAGVLAVALALWRRSGLASPLATIGALLSVALFVEEVVFVGAICLLCEVVHVAFLALAVTTELWRRREAIPLVRSRQDFAWVLGLPALLLATTAVALPHYWAAAAWLRDDLPLAHGEDEAGHPWIGAEQPEIAFEEWVDYRCPHCAVASRQTARWVTEHPELRLIRRHQPGMRCRPIERAPDLCLGTRAAICAGKQGKFWAMDAMLFGKPSRTRADLQPAIEALALDPVAFDACMDHAQTYETAAREFEAAHEARIRSTPSYRVDGQVMAPKEFWPWLREQLSVTAKAEGSVR